MTDYERGRLDGIRQSLKALDGHGFHDTAHARVRRLLSTAVDPVGCFCGQSHNRSRVHRAHACEPWMACSDDALPTDKNN